MIEERSVTNTRQTLLDIRRVYDAPLPGEGARVLVDRLWPRGVRKADLELDAWRRDLAPSAELRRWFGHDPARWEEFQRRYAAELEERQADLDSLVALAWERGLTLLYGARDRRHNNAEALRRVLLARLDNSSPTP